jgi:hypothetical protein
MATTPIEQRFPHPDQRPSSDQPRPADVSHLGTLPTATATSGTRRSVRLAPQPPRTEYRVQARTARYSSQSTPFQSNPAAGSKRHPPDWRPGTWVYKPRPRHQTHQLAPHAEASDWSRRTRGGPLSDPAGSTTTISSDGSDTRIPLRISAPAGPGSRRGACTSCTAACPPTLDA